MVEPRIVEAVMDGVPLKGMPQIRLLATDLPIDCIKQELLLGVTV